MSIKIGIGKLRIGAGGSQSWLKKAVAENTAWRESYLEPIDAILNDGNTVAWFDAEASDTITKDESNRVSLWKDKLLSGRDLVQVDTDKMPVQGYAGTRTSMYFEGTDEYMRLTATVAQPFKIYMVYRHHGAITESGIFNSVTPDANIRFQAKDGVYKILGGTGWGATYPLPQQQCYNIVSILFAGTSSVISINDIAGTPASGGVKGFTAIDFGGSSALGTYEPLDIDEIIIRKVNDSAEVSTAIYNYLRVKWFEVFKTPKLLFTYDGNNKEIIDDYMPIHIAESTKCTIYVVGDHIGIHPNYFPNWDVIRAARDAGMDIQDHSKTHSKFTEITEAAQIAEYEYMNALFPAQGLAVPRFMLIPYAVLNQQVINTMSLYRLTNRTIEKFAGIFQPILNRKYVDMYNFQAFQIDNISEANVALFKTFMDQAVANNGYMFFYGHGEINLPDPATHLARFTDLLQYAKAAGFDIVTMSEFYEFIHQ